MLKSRLLSTKSHSNSFSAPQSSVMPENNVLFKISGKQLGWIVVPLPLGALITCIIWSIIYDFEASTATHCRVANYLPSISAMIGGFTPQRYIWRVCIALHSWPRFMAALAYYQHYMSFPVTRKRTLYSWLAFLNSALHIVENFSLVMLTYVSSTENYFIHENSFITFMVTSISYMLLTCLLFKWSRSTQTVMTKNDLTSWRWKVIMVSVNIFSILAATYFFVRHNSYCEPGVYTAFAFGEYMVVFSNIFFHATKFIEFGDNTFAFTEPARIQKND